MDFLKLKSWIKRKRGLAYTSLLRGSAASIGKGSIIYPPFHSNNLKQMFMGENCSVHPYGWIDCVSKYAEKEFNPKLEIGDDTYIGHSVHIIACGHMKIGKKVLIAERVYITDNLHGYKDTNMSMLSQPLEHPGTVTIEDEAWIGDGVCILPGVTIGKHSVIGSNAVVTKDIPAYCVAAGVPASIIKRYNQTSGEWEKCLVEPDKRLAREECVEHLSSRTNLLVADAVKHNAQVAPGLPPFDTGRTDGKAAYKPDLCPNTDLGST